MASNIEYPAQKLFVARITAVGSAVGADAAGTGYIPHAWQEVRLSGSGRAYVDDELGLVGTTTVCPAYDPNGSQYTVGAFVYMRMRGWSDADSGIIFDIIGLASSGSTGGSGGGSTTGGGVTFSGARVTNSAAQLVGALPTYLDFDTEEFDTGGYHSIVSNTSRFTIPESGYYQVGYSVAYVTLEVPAAVWTGIYKNRSSLIHSKYDSLDSFVSGLASLTTASSSTLASLAAGDYVEIIANGYDTDAILETYASSGFPSPVFWIYKVG